MSKTTTPSTDVRNQQGAVSWGELLCNDPEKMKAFYAAVFGYQAHTSDMPQGAAYTSLSHNGKPFAGIMQKPPHLAQTPSHWGLYITVDNIAETLEKCTASGGQIVLGTTPIEGVGQFAILQDPEGAVFQVMQYTMTFE